MSVVAEVTPGILLPLLIAATALTVARLFPVLRFLSVSMRRWLFCCATAGLIVPAVILLTYPPNTDAALNAASGRLLWPSHLILMAGEPHDPPSTVAFLVGMSVFANIVAYMAIGLLVWTVAPFKRHQH